MHNLLVKLRGDEAFTVKEREPHAAAQSEILRQLHDELDAAVIQAYGWKQEQGNHRFTPRKIPDNARVGGGMNTDNSFENHSLIGVHRSSSVVKESFPPMILSDAEILERLVALNKERAAEEARGLVRWLRPEYQSPQAAQPVAELILHEETEVEAVVSGSAPEPQPWPKELKDQLAALRGVLLASRRLWALEAVGQSFRSRGRYRESIAAHLELLTDLGMLSRVDTADGPRWHRPQAMGA